MLRSYLATAFSYAALALAVPSYIDAPHITLPTSNDTTPFQYWLFDLVSPQGFSIIVNFVAGHEFSGDAGLPAYRAQITTLFPNGTLSNAIGSSLPVGTITALENGFSNGVYPGIGGWTADEHGYTVNFTAGSVSGDITLEPLAPGHYACDSNVEPSFHSTVAPNLVGPWLGWTSSVPSANGVANLSINGEAVQFAGSAYHHSVFGLKPLAETASHWYWARGTAGLYTFAYFSYLPKNTSVTSINPNTWYTSGYLAKGGIQLANFCTAEQNASAYALQHVEIETFGPVWGLGPDTLGFYSTANGTVGATATFIVDGARYVFNQTSIAVALPGGAVAPYVQFSSTIEGGQVGEPAAQGLGYFDVLNYGP